MHTVRGNGRPSTRRGGFLLSFLVLGGVLAGGFVLAGHLLGLLGSTTVTKDRSAPPILTELRDLARYKAASGSFEQLIDVESDVRWVPSALAGERTLLVAVGKVDAEVDFSGLNDRHIVVSPDGQSVEIHLPPAELSEASLDLDRTHVASRQKGLANRLSQAVSTSPSDDSALLRLARDRINETAAQTELTARAEINTRGMLMQLIRSLGIPHVSVVFDGVPAGGA